MIGSYLFFELFCIACYLLLFIFLFNKSKIFSLYIFPFVHSLGVLISIIIIDNADVKLEVLISERNAAFVLMLVFSLVGMIFFYYLVRKCNHWVIKIPRQTSAYFYIILFVMIVPLVLALVRNFEIDRFHLIDNYPFPHLFGLLLNLLNGIYVFTLLTTPEFRKRASIFIAMAFFLFISGNQFGGYINIILWLIVSMKLRDEVIKPAAFIILGLAFISSLIFKIHALSSTDVDIMSRFAMQGQLFYAILNEKFFAGYIDAPAIYNFAESFFKLDTYSTTSEYGFGRLMLVIMGSEAYAYLDNNVRLAAGYPAIFIYHFNYRVAFILNIILILIYVKFFLRHFFIYLSRRGVLFFALYFKLFLIYCVELMEMGDYGQLKFKFFALLVILLLWDKLMWVRKH